MAKIAFLGLGAMGRGMAAQLLQAGNDVTVWNRSPDKSETLAEVGAKVATTPKEAATGAEAVFSMVADDQASNQCWFVEDGAMHSMMPGAFVIECSTISHAQSAKIAKAAQSKELRYIDCPVNGMPSAAARGELTLLVGANPEDLSDARTCLEAISSSILHFGPVGTGTAYKLINNLLGAVHVAATAEAAQLARKLGLDVDVMAEAIETGPVGSPHTKRMIRPMLENRPADSFGLAIGLREKDARYCLSMAQNMGLSMTVGEEAHGWYVAALQTHASEDDSLLLQTIALHGGKVPGRR